MEIIDKTPRLITYLASGQPVFDKPGQNAFRLTRPSEMMEAVIADIQTVDAAGRIWVSNEFDGVNSWETDIVQTYPGDYVFWARSTEKFGIFRFVRDRQSEQSNVVHWLLVRNTNPAVDDYYLTIVAAGEAPEPHPDKKPFFDSQAAVNPFALRDATYYWKHHAYREESMDIDYDTLIYDNPWEAD